VHVRRTLLLAPVTLLCLAGCGPPKAQTPGHYALKPTADCLRKSGLKVVPNAPGDDLVAQSAPAGVLRSSLHGKRFLVLFGNTQTDTKLMEEGYRRAAPTPRARRRLRSLFDLEGNALVYWATEPTAAQADAVRGCLRS
jgi:hypothetical protein